MGYVGGLKPSFCHGFGVQRSLPRLVLDPLQSLCLKDLVFDGLTPKTKDKWVQGIHCFKRLQQHAKNLTFSHRDVWVLPYVGIVGSVSAWRSNKMIGYDVNPTEMSN